MFLLIDSVEILIKGKRPILNFNESENKSNYYGKGVIDVISPLKMNESKDNQIIKYLNNDDNFSKTIYSLDF